MPAGERRTAAPEPLWRPDERRREAANVTAFMRWLADTRGLSFDDYHALRRWSVDDLEAFWHAVWDYFELESSASPSAVLGAREMPGAEWFPGARLNFSQWLLAAHRPGRVAIVHHSEARPSGELTWDELSAQVRALAVSLRRMGVRPGERVAAYLPTMPEAVVAMLATTGIGAVWCCCSPDFGVAGVLDRFAPVAPKVLIAADGYRYGGRDFDRRAAIREMVEGLPSLRHLVAVPCLAPGGVDAHDLVPDGDIETAAWPGLIEAGDGDSPEDFPFEDTAFDHPLWIAYSSGTTGPPKAFVHGHGGVLLECLKAQHFHMDLKPESRMFFYTTTGWIVFPNLVAALLTGASIVLYDGDPLHPGVDRLWKIAESSGVTHFGVSPTFVKMQGRHGIVPRERYDLSRLECVVCTGSPLTPESFSWVYDNVKRDLWVTSVSGGTDIVTPFVGGVPTLPVHSGEIQARCLGVDVHAYDPDGRPVIDREGELVVAQPMPSMPLRLWDDPDGRRYRESYFETFPGVWRHGDRLIVTSRGSCIIPGRSDSTLNRYGVRIGTSEVYRTVDGVDGVRDSLVVNLELPDGEFLMPLFVVLDEGRELDDALAADIRARLRGERSPRHVPDRIVAVEAIPYTLTGKKMEVPVKRVLMGEPADTVVNRDAMADPAAIDFFVDYARREVPAGGESA